MAASRNIASALRCSSCQRQVLNAFISSINPSLRLSIRETLPQARRQVRSIATSAARRLDVVSPGETDRRIRKDVSGLAALEAEVGLEESQENNKAPEQEVEVEQDEAGAEAEADRSEAGTPWYLEAQEEEVPINPFAERQQLPDLPANAPPILQPLLQHISIDLGIDYLNIIDLRLLDPPAALGANLIMLFGTARSEKHLNVSADRLCRWLRTNYKLTPHADGLLGRNELKLKLRRKARRSRMLGAAGTTEAPNADDGITTGWVCVDVGSVDNGSGAPQPEKEEPKLGFIGFGSRSDQAKIVVQMMTEEKRGEVDLEGLWQSTLDREGRKREGEKRAKDKREAGGSDVEESVEDFLSRQDQQQQRHAFPPSSPTGYPAQQVRRFHTSRKRHRADDARSAMIEAQELEDELEPHLLPDELSSNAGPLSPSAAAISLRTHVEYLKKLNRNVALAQLGKGDQDRDSTSFLQTFYAAMPSFPDIQHCLSLIDLQCHALRISAPGYTRLHLLSLFREAQMFGHQIPASTFHLGLSAILLSPHSLDSTSVRKNPAFDGLNALKRSLSLSFELLEQLEANGYEPRSEQILFLILESITSPTFSDPADIAADKRMYLAPHDFMKLLHNFRRGLLHQPVLTTPATPSDHQRALPASVYVNINMHILRLSLTRNLPSSVWTSWRALPRLLLPRPAEMYAVLFNGIADTGNQMVALETLEACVPEMSREMPRVEMKGEVARGVVRLMRVAGVDVGMGVWRRTFERAREGLIEEGEGQLD